MIDFFGPGYEVADRMGLLPELEKVHYPVDSLIFLGPDGRDGLSLAYPVLRRRLFAGRHFNFMRGDLEEVLWKSIQGQIDLRWGATVNEISQDREAVRVTLSDGTTQAADVVVGADGVHSGIRELAFGGETQFVRHLGYNAAAFIVDDANLARAAGRSLRTLTLVGRQIAIYPIRGDRVACFLAHRSAAPPREPTLQAARKELRAVYDGVGWVVPRLLEHLESTPSIYYDAVTQVVMPSWSIGRVVLCGDACGCVSLLAGQGASLAFAGAYVLAHAVSSADPAIALRRYEQRMRPEIESRQRMGRDMGRWFVPEGRFTITLRNLAMRSSIWPPVSAFIRRKLASDDFLSENPESRERPGLQRRP
jgi:2-polyprenyl-6-methoxyphenol hydroxylase-like FAD-dependent oxidoreductase